MKPLITIIIPIYNVEKYLRKCVESVLNQTYRNLEVILADDGSNDACDYICDEYARIDKRVTVIHKQNGGLSSARNVGLNVAQGEYIGFVDSDDYIDANMYENLYSALSKTAADMAICNFKRVDGDGVRVYAKNEKPPLTNAILVDYCEMIQLLYRYHGVANAYNKLYKKKLFERIRYPDGRLHEDEFIIHRILHLCGSIVTVPDTSYFALSRKGSVISTGYSDKRFEDRLAAFMDREQFFKDTGYRKLCKFTMRSVYGLLIEAIESDWYRNNKRNIKNGLAAGTVVKLALHFDLRALKLLYVFNKYPIEKLLTFKFYLYFMFNCLKTKSPRIFLLATPTHGNLGDHAITYAERKLFKKLDYQKRLIEVSHDDYLRNAAWLQTRIKPLDIITIDGGGNLGTLWKHNDDKITDIITQFTWNKIFIFPQTCFYHPGAGSAERLERNKRKYAACKDLTVCLRDKMSYDFARANFDGVKLLYAPDIALSLSCYIKGKHLNRNGVLLCLRSDREKSLSVLAQTSISDFLIKNQIPFIEASTVIKRLLPISCAKRKRELYRKWREFKRSRIVVTDRLHGLIFAAITGTPCIAVDNESGKINGAYQWISGLRFIHFADRPELINAEIAGMYGEALDCGRFVYPDTVEKEIRNWRL
ncbi:MAG: glycosyltransferase [Clostridiales bacterium]|jgi:exopolysaccharide biosynthesis predicted pyruvyltransferase EpsI|nr:glycosyltransferase [Clostridiales bacterium]